MRPSRRLPLTRLATPTTPRTLHTRLPTRRLPISQTVISLQQDRTPEAEYTPIIRATNASPDREQQTPIQTHVGHATTDATNRFRRLHHPPGRRFPQPPFSPRQRRNRDPIEPQPVRNVRPRVVTTNRQGDPASGTIRLATLNIISGRAERLVAASRALQQMNVDVAILTETKITDECYTRHSFGYEIRASKAPSTSQGGVAICWRDNELSQTEGIRFHGPNVLSCEITSGQKRWLLIGAYIPPNEVSNETVSFIQEAHLRQPLLPVILLGDLNVDFRTTNMTSAREASIAGLVANLGVEDMLKHFKQTKRHKNGDTWRMNRQDQIVQSRCDYIMAEDRREFLAVKITSPRLFDSDHKAVVAVLQVKTKKDNQQYRKQRSSFPLKVPRGQANQAEQLQKQLIREARTAADPINRRSEWISPATWTLVDRRAQGRRNNSIAGNDLRRLNSQIRNSLRRDRKTRTETAAADIQEALAQKDKQTAWQILKRWYRLTTGRPPKPTRLDMSFLENEYTALYKATPSPGVPIPIHYHGNAIDDSTPNEEEILRAVQRLKAGKAPGPSGLRVDEIKKWMMERTTQPDPWDKFCLLVKHCFETGELPQSACFSTLVLIPKSDGGVRGIGLLESVWKVMSMIIKERMSRTIQFDDMLHGFRPGRGTGTAILEARLHLDKSIHQGKTLAQIFLDLSKAYDTLDRDRTIQILQAYGVGPRLLQLLQSFWNNLQLVPRQGGYYGRPIKSERGVTQGDPLSPIVFNVVVDAVVRHIRASVPPGTLWGLFYADDGWLASHNPTTLQYALELATDLFHRMGLRMNASKTKAMNSHPGSELHYISTPAFSRRMLGNGPTYSATQRRVTTCPVCESSMQQRNLRHHLISQHQIFERPKKRPKSSLSAHNAPNSYNVSMPSGWVTCPVPNCDGRASTRDSMRVHFAHRHPFDTIIINEEGLLPRCERCDMFVPLSALISHPLSDRCISGTERKRKRLQEIANVETQNTSFVVGETELEAVDSFRYLGRPLVADSSDWLAVNYNIKRARGRWAQVSRVLTKQQITPRTAGFFYKAVVQSVLLYGCETWSLSKQSISALEGFHNQIARKIARQTIHPNPHTGEWIYPPAETARNISGLFPIQHYIRIRRAYIMNWTHNRPLFNECRNLIGGAGGPQRRYWWNPTTLLVVE
jgi:exonuclease III